jgi:hypothetical protein
MPVQKNGSKDKKMGGRMGWIWDPKPLRTHAQVKLIQENLLPGQVGELGYKGRSPLLDIAGFDIIKVISDLRLYRPSDGCPISTHRH